MIYGRSTCVRERHALATGVWSTYRRAHGGSEKLTTDSEFFRHYPREGFINPTYADGTRDSFEALTLHIAVAFRKDKARLWCTDTAHGGILEWSQIAIDLSKTMSQIAIDMSKRMIKS
jgi:hypothetical protein